MQKPAEPPNSTGLAQRLFSVAVQEPVTLDFQAFSAQSESGASHPSQAYQIDHLVRDPRRRLAVRRQRSYRRGLEEVLAGKGSKSFAFWVGTAGLAGTVAGIQPVPPSIDRCLSYDARTVQRFRLRGQVRKRSHRKLKLQAKARSGVPWSFPQCRD